MMLLLQCNYLLWYLRIVIRGDQDAVGIPCTIKNPIQRSFCQLLIHSKAGNPLLADGFLGIGGIAGQKEILFTGGNPGAEHAVGMSRGVGQNDTSITKNIKGLSH